MQIDCSHLSLTALAGFDSILTRQHDHPVLAIPAGVERDFTHGKVCVRDRLPSVLSAIAIFVDHLRPEWCLLKRFYLALAILIKSFIFSTRES